MGLKSQSGVTPATNGSLTTPSCQAQLGICTVCPGAAASMRQVTVSCSPCVWGAAELLGVCLLERCCCAGAGGLCCCAPDPSRTRAMPSRLLRVGVRSQGVFVVDSAQGATAPQRVSAAEWSARRKKNTERGIACVSGWVREGCASLERARTADYSEWGACARPGPIGYRPTPWGYCVVLFLLQTCAIHTKKACALISWHMLSMCALADVGDHDFTTVCAPHHHQQPRCHNQMICSHGVPRSLSTTRRLVTCVERSVTHAALSTLLSIDSRHVWPVSPTIVYMCTYMYV
jgi:hypothetical protein